jgi:hypothetical protein
MQCVLLGVLEGAGGRALGAARGGGVGAGSLGGEGRAMGHSAAKHRVTRAQ